MTRRYLLQVGPPLIVLVVGLILYGLGLRSAVYPALVALLVVVFLLVNRGPY